MADGKPEGPGGGRRDLRELTRIPRGGTMDAHQWGWGISQPRRNAKEPGAACTATTDGCSFHLPETSRYGNLPLWAS